ncbi:MAG: hypothetical protein WA733_21825 [Methylocystis sp.]|jgi:hypothetical protein
MIDRIEETTSHEPAPAETTAPIAETDASAPVADASAPVAQPAKKPRKPRAPRAPKPAKLTHHQRQALSVEPSVITLETRLRCGLLTVNEICALAACGRSALYADARKGLIHLEKRGGRRRCAGPEVVRYLNAKSGE